MTQGDWLGVLGLLLDFLTEDIGVRGLIGISRFGLSQR
jgi:hypothetical protein